MLLLLGISLGMCLDGSASGFYTNDDTKDHLILMS